MTNSNGFAVNRFIDRSGRRLPIHHEMTGPSFKGDDLRSVEQIALEGEGFAQLGTLYLDVRIEARIVQPCDRCLKPVTSTVVLNESFEVPVPPEAEMVDLWDPVLRLVMSAHDPYVLCAPTCRGLCPTCGADLNEAPDHKCASDTGRSTLGDRLR